MTTTPHRWLPLLPLSDFAAAVAGYFLARAVRPITDGVPFLHSYFDPSFTPALDFFLPFALAGGAAFVLAAALSGSYRSATRLPLWQLLLAVIWWALLLIAYFALVRHEVIFGRMMLAQAMIFTLLLAVVLRTSIAALLRRTGAATRVLLLATTTQWQQQIANSCEYSCVGSAATLDGLPAISADELWLLGDTSDARAAVLDFCAERHLTLCWQPHDELALVPVELRTVLGRPLLRTIATPLSGWARVVKRLLDTVGSALLLVLLAPLLLVIAAAVRLTSRGGALYASQRVGRDGKLFTIYKFRSMRMGAEHERAALAADNHRTDGPLFKIKNDPRVTPFGRVLRRWSLDELPQLWNVLRGEMSLIGPRPHLPDEIAEFTPQLKRLLRIKPGLSGLAQVSGRSDLSFADEMQLDLYYLDNWSLLLDAVIFLKSIAVVVGGRGAD